MGKYTNDSAMDAMLGWLDDATKLHVCSAQPANYAGIAAVQLAIVTLTAGAGNGDYTLANGDTSGRKLTVAQQTAIPIDTSGTATHIALSDGSSSLYCVTTCNSQALLDTGTVTTPAWDIEVSDPT